jgi:hypothetical protein
MAIELGENFTIREPGRPFNLAKFPMLYAETSLNRRAGGGLSHYGLEDSGDLSRQS